MNRAKYLTLLFHLLRIGVGLVFVWASLYKIKAPADFAHQIYNYKLLPVWAINPVALFLPWLQLFCGLALAFRRFSLGAGFLVALMMIVFQGAVASALLRGLNISCGCFKAGGEAATWLTFARDSILMVLSLIVVWSEMNRFSTKKWT